MSGVTLYPPYLPEPDASIPRFTFTPVRAPRQHLLVDWTLRAGARSGSGRTIPTLNGIGTLFPFRPIPPTCTSAKSARSPSSTWKSFVHPLPDTPSVSTSPARPAIHAHGPDDMDGSLEASTSHLAEQVHVALSSGFKVDMWNVQSSDIEGSLGEAEVSPVLSSATPTRAAAKLPKASPSRPTFYSPLLARPPATYVGVIATGAQGGDDTARD